LYYEDAISLAGLIQTAIARLICNYNVRCL